MNNQYQTGCPPQQYTTVPAPNTGPMQNVPQGTYMPPQPIPQPQQQQQPESRFIYGGITQIPEMRITQNNSPVTDLNVAVQENGQTMYYKISVWGNAARAVTALKKGDRIAAYGKYTRREYQKRDGSMGYQDELQYASVFLDFSFILDAVMRMVGGYQQQAPQQQQMQPGSEYAYAQPQPQFTELKEDSELPF